MITVSDEYKIAVKSPVKEMLAYIDDGVDEITQADDLKNLTIKGTANIGKAVMRYAEAVYIGEHDYLDSYVNLGVGVMLPDVDEIGEVTITIASPALLTHTAHGLNTGDRVRFTTTDALPTGLAVDTDYFVIRNNADTFWVASSYDNALAGTKINTSGTQSGTHTLFFYPTGIGTTPEYINHGAFKVVSIEHNQGTDEVKIKMYDRMFEALKKWDLEPTYPLTMLGLLQAICTELGWTLADTTFPNDDLSIASDLFTEPQLSYRAILDYIAEASASIIYFGADDELHVRQISDTVLETLTSENLMSLKVEPIYQELNSVVLSRQPQEDNIAQQDSESISTYGLHEFKIVNNALVDSDRETYITDIYNTLVGLTYHPFEAETEGLGYFEFGDRIKVQNPSETEYEVLVMDIDMQVGTGFKERIKADIPLKTVTPYQYAGIIGQQIKNTEIIVNKVEGEILLINEALETVLSVPRQPEPPESPSTNDLWLDTDDNIIYIYDGAEWQPTSISPDTLEGYYTKEETDVQISLTESSILSSVQETHTTALQGLDLAEANQDEILSLSERTTTLEQTADALELTVEGIGGVNLLKNSSGLKGSIEEWQELDENGDPLDADNDGTVVQTTDVQNNTESGSGIQIAEQFITQTFPTLEGNTYTLYCRFNKLGDLDALVSGVAEPIPVAGGGYVDETWDVFKYTFVASEASTTIRFTNVGDTGASAIIADAVCKIGDVSGWQQAPNEVYGKNFRFDKEGFSITSESNSFKATLDEDSLTVEDTATSKIAMQVAKDQARLTNATVQDELIVQRYENPDASMRMIPVDDGVMLVIND